MKLTKTQLKQIIKEELGAINEQEYSWAGPLERAMLDLKGMYDTVDLKEQILFSDKLEEHIRGMVNAWDVARLGPGGPESPSEYVGRLSQDPSGQADLRAMAQGDIPYPWPAGEEEY